MIELREDGSLAVTERSQEGRVLTVVYPPEGVEAELRRRMQLLDGDESALGAMMAEFRQLAADVTAENRGARLDAITDRMRDYIACLESLHASLQEEGHDDGSN
jgi:hypothetical protein